MSEAREFWSRHARLSTAEIVKALEAFDLDKDQDWEDETTTWVFPDGSAIRVNSYQEVSCFEKGDSK